MTPPLLLLLETSHQAVFKKYTFCISSKQLGRRPPTKAVNIDARLSSSPVKAATHQPSDHRRHKTSMLLRRAAGWVAVGGCPDSESDETFNKHE